MKMKDRHVDLLSRMIGGVLAARSGDKPDADELERITNWLDFLVKGLTAVDLVQAGVAVMYWEEDTDEPSFALTEKGMEEGGYAGLKDASLN